MDKQYILTKEQAKKIVLANKYKMVHIFYNLPFGLIGCDRSLESIYKDIDSAYLLLIAGESARALQHCLVIMPDKNCKQSELLFVETKYKIEDNTDARL